MYRVKAGVVHVKMSHFMKGATLSTPGCRQLLLSDPARSSVEAKNLYLYILIIINGKANLPHSFRNNA
jgi:hypothetical protein